MKADKRSLSELFQGETRLSAPLFQRPYVWNEEDNWEPLWNAIQELALARLSGENPKPYFMGALVLDKLSGQTGSVVSREIIDGQQRLTTLQIFLSVLSERLSGDPQMSRVLDSMTRNNLGSGDEVFKVWPTNIDREQFRAVMTGVKVKGLMRDAREYFSSRLNEFAENESEVTSPDEAVFNAVFRDLAFVVIDLESDDDGQLIFETLNSLGTPLLPSDLVKNLLFRAAQAEDRNSDELYLRFWQPFEEDAEYWRAIVYVGKRERTRLDVFLQHYLMYRMGKDSLVAHNFRDYREMFGRGELGDVENALADFKAFSDSYREFEEEISDGVSGRLRHLLLALNLNTPFPLLMGIYHNVHDLSEREEMIKDIESYLVRRSMTNLSTQGLNHSVASLIQQLKRIGWTSENLRRLMLEFEGNTRVWPSDEFLIWRIQNRATYFSVRRQGIAYVLSRIEEDLRSKYAETTLSFRQPIHIEHIMPQKWKRHWGGRTMTSEEEGRRQESIHLLGNLTILTDKLNQSVSNAGWEKKREALEAHSVLRLNKELASFDEWNEESIAARTADLAHRICRLWPRPGG
ncbi:DUF262 domain-containing HNH endonuclease family protein [Kamptonema cortianum]|nr:DUF262 domain-containing HNH endonuclease family protein [Geitlerinema splendidum]MDK3158597.1 DUF262 domain-containing HNH endonuclease family protein [Kamptonema cortianum]